MTRVDADRLLTKYDDARMEFRLAVGTAKELIAWHKMNALRERLIDRLCGEDATDVLPGRAL